MQSVGAVCRLRNPITRIASVKISAARQNQRNISTGSTSPIFSRQSALKRAEELKKWKSLAQKAQSLLHSLSSQRRALATESQKSSEATGGIPEDLKAEYAEKIASEQTSNSSGSSGSGPSGENPAAGSQTAGRQQRPKSPLLLVFLLCVIIVEALTIYSLYINYIGDDWMKFLCFVPGAQWVPALTVADMSYWWLAFPLVHWPLNRAITSLFYKQRTLGTFVIMQISWLSVLAFTMFHRYNMLEHLDANSTWATLLMSINPTKIFMFALTAFQVDQYGKTPNFLAKRTTEAEVAKLQPGQHSVVVFPPPVPITTFYTSGWKRLTEAAAGQRTTENNPLLFGSAWAAAQFGVGKPETEVASNTPTTQQTNANPKK